MRQVLMFLSLFALGGYALGNAVGYVYVEDWLPKATEKLVKKYYELEAKLKELEERQIYVLEERGKWVKVRTEKGVEGWSFKRYLGQLEARK